MQLGIFAKTFAAQGADAVFRAVRQAGYGAVQFNMACVGLPSLPRAVTAELTAEIATAAKTHGVSISAVSATYNMAHPDASVRADGLRSLSVILQAATQMGSPMVTLCTGTRHTTDQWHWHKDNATPEAWADMRAEMAKALTLAEAHGVDLGIEPELANVVSNAALAKRLIDEMKSKHLRVVLDPANLFEVETELKRNAIIADAVALLGDDIAMAHAKDRDAHGAFVAAGTGVIDFKSVLHQLREVGFDGPIITHGLTETEAPQVASYLKSVMPQ
ncbi:MAG: sugar phosphate isomerase/epimerase [Alphaproteobacteria bacterium]|nr:sugar phosphate isomerase/epimerase [Alphaproteobacteria bacterium]